MERIFFGKCFNVSDTIGNRRLNKCLRKIETKFVDIFDISTEGFDSFSEWAKVVANEKPEVSYLFEWMKEDSCFCDFGHLELEDLVSDELLDEFSMVDAMLEDMDKDDDIEVLCSDVADMVYFLDKALKKEVYHDDEQGVYMEPFDLYSLSEFNSNCMNASFTTEGAFLIAA
ncbi:MAG: hypothetical protein J6I62_01560 [Selenomonadaceae bacterium]|nr:hypothetical protein [Selenomonadaceae bacterium]